MKINGEKEKQIREAIRASMPSCHCLGCDEWACGGDKGKPDWDDEEIEAVLNAVLLVLRRKSE